MAGRSRVEEEYNFEDAAVVPFWAGREIGWEIVLDE
jgi:hypothetical protein